MKKIDYGSQISLLEQAKEVLTEAFQAPFHFDLKGDAFKIILESWGDDRVDKQFADQVKTMLKIRFNLFGTDLSLSMDSNNPNSALLFGKYVLINMQVDGKKTVLALNIMTGEIEEKFEGANPAQEAYQKLFHQGMLAAITDATRGFAGATTIGVITIGDRKE